MILALLMAAAFEKVALVDSLDFATWYDIETERGTVETLEHVLLSHPTTILWRDKGGGRMRYPSKVEMSDLSEQPLLKTRIPREDVYGWLRLDNPRGPDIFGLVRRECAERQLTFGIHTTWEENHWMPELVSNWTMKHPEFWSRRKDEAPWLGCCSIAYPEVVAHKLAFLDERIALGPKEILLDFLRCGSWSPAREYVAPVLARWKAKYGCEPPDDPKDARWLETVSPFVHGYLRAFSKKCREKGVRFTVAFPGVDCEDRHIYETYAIDWKALAREGVFDGIYVLNIRLDTKDPWGCTERTYKYVMDHRGRADVYFPVSTYDFFRSGIPSYVKATGSTSAQVTRRLLDMAQAAGARGVVLECVDHCNYKPDMNAELAK